METMEAILSRRSIRSYTDQPITDEQVHQILTAGMSGPSAVNARDWHFIVVRGEALEGLAQAAGRAGAIIRRSQMTVLICCDESRAFPPAKQYAVIDGAIAGQNMILAAQSMGIGSVWLGVWPQDGKVEAQKNYFKLPETAVPHSLIAFGYPAEDKSGEPHPDYEESRVHWNQW